MQIEITVTSPEGNSQRYVQQKNAGNPVRFNVPPGAKVDVQIDGVKQTGKELINQQATQLRKNGKDLIIETADGEAQIELSNFYQDAAEGETAAILSGSGWSYTEAEQLNLTLEGVVATSEFSETGALVAAPLVAGAGLGVAGLFAVGAVSLTSSSSDNTTGAAINIISAAAQADNANATTPSVETYTAAGVTGVTASNVAALNSILNDVDITGAKTDTTAKIQSIVDSYNLILASADGKSGNSTAPTATDYENIGINGIDTAQEVGLLGSVIDGKTNADVDTVDEMQALADAVQAVIGAAENGTPLPTKAQLDLLGISGVTQANLAAVVQGIIAKTGNDVDTLAELQAVISTITVPLVDTVAPTLTISDNTPGTANGPVTFTFTFSESVAGFAANKINIVGGTAGVFNKINDSTYTLVVSPLTSPAAGNIVVSVSANAVADLAGNLLTTAVSNTQAYNLNTPATDTTPPTLVITDNVSAVTATGPVQYTFTFSEAVSGFDASKLTVTGGTAGTFTKINDSLYTLVVTPTANATGNIVVTASATGVIDLASNVMVQSTGLTSTQAYNTTG
ncbi:MAG: hypothetical protein FGM56_05785, partial [Limnohabitans sp.]|nr:hypothetical protein [Limnohabitans sp.]